MNKESFLKLYSKYKLFIFPAVVTLSSLILIAFVIFPQVIKLISNQKNGDDLLQRTQFLEAKAQTLEAFDQEDLSKKVNFAVNVFPPDKDFGDAIGIIQEITNQAGFSIESLSIGGGIKQAGSESYNVSLEISGPKALLSSMLSGFENAPRLIRIGNINISPNSGSEGIQASLGLVILYKDVPKDFGSVDSPLPELSQKDQDLLVKLASTQSVSQVNIDTSNSTSPRGKENPFE